MQISEMRDCFGAVNRYDVATVYGGICEVNIKLP